MNILSADMKIKVGLVDDQQLFLRSLYTLIKTFASFEVIVDALNGDELLSKIAQHELYPEIILIDVNMPEKDGAQTAAELRKLRPLAKLVALSMNDEDSTIIAMIKAGCCAYLLKDVHPVELEKALLEVQRTGFYNGDYSNLNFRRLLLYTQQEEKFTEREKAFLQLACSDLTYKQIAAAMHLSERTIDGYREALFQKLNVQSRVGMVLEGFKRGLVSI
jgi:DNA-binding NarL/FixJ family response regulator